jgi:hypothetical protein
LPAGDQAVGELVQQDRHEEGDGEEEAPGKGRNVEALRGNPELLDDRRELPRRDEGDIRDEEEQRNVKLYRDFPEAERCNAVIEHGSLPRFRSTRAEGRVRLAKHGGSGLVTAPGRGWKAA